MKAKIKVPKLPKIDGKTVKDHVEWLRANDCGCCRFHLIDTDEYRIHICIGWHEFDETEPGPEVKVGNCTMSTFKHKPVWKTAWKIGMETFNNAMQTDLDVDFIMPYDSDTGDVCDTLTEIGEAKTMKYWNAIAADMNKCAIDAVRWQLEEEAKHAKD